MSHLFWIGLLSSEIIKSYTALKFLEGKVLVCLLGYSFSQRCTKACLAMDRIKSRFVHWMACALDGFHSFFSWPSCVELNYFEFYDPFLYDLSVTFPTLRSWRQLSGIFLWTEATDVSKTVIVSLKKVYLPKKYSGLGVQSLKLFNRTLLKKLM